MKENQLEADIQIVQLDAVRPHPKNPRIGDVDAIRKSVRAHGFYGTLVAQKSTGYLIKGNHTWRALREEGYEQVRVQYLDVSDELAVSILLADNKASDTGEYDERILLDLLQEVTNTEATLYSGSEIEYLQRLFADAERATAESKSSGVDDPDIDSLNAAYIGEPLVESFDVVFHISDKETAARLSELLAQAGSHDELALLLLESIA